MKATVSQPRPAEQALIERAAQGDEEAFAELFRLHFAPVYNFALWLSGDPAQAEDLTQEAFVRAHTQLPRFGPPWKLRAWLFRTARNLFIGTLRHTPAAEPLEAEAPIPAGDEPPESSAIARERDVRVRAALASLPTAHREALVLREVEGFPYADIASVMNISLDYVRVLLHRARAKFQQIYSLRLLAEEPLAMCPVLGELLDAYQDGEAPRDREQYIREHVRGCSRCQQRQRELASLAMLLGGLPPVPPPGHLGGAVLRKSTGRTHARPLHLRGVHVALAGAAVAAVGLGWALWNGAAGGPPSAPAASSTPPWTASPQGTAPSISLVLFLTSTSSAVPPSTASFTPYATATASRTPTRTPTRTPSPTLTPTADITGPSIKAVADAPDPIYVTQPKGCSPNASVVSASITDPSGVASAVVIFFHTTIGQVPMTNVGGNNWQATIGPYTGTGDGTADYQIRAVDTQGNTSDSIFYQVTVLACIP